MPEKNELRNAVITCIWENTNLTVVRSNKVADKILTAVRERVKGLPVVFVNMAKKPHCYDAKYAFLKSDLLRELGEKSK